MGARRIRVYIIYTRVIASMMRIRARVSRMRGTAT